MNVCLLYEKSEAVPKGAILNRNEIVQDLNLDIIFKLMSRNDPYIYKTVRTVLTNPLTDKISILYRQGIVTDCIKNYDDFYKIYEMTSQVNEAYNRYVEGMKRVNSSNMSNAASVLSSLELLGILVDGLDQLKVYLDSVEMVFQSNGMRLFYNRLCEDYSHRFVQEIKDTMKNMSFLTEGGEITFSGTIGQGLKTKDIIVNQLKKDERKGKKSLGAMVQQFYNMFRHNTVILNDSKLDQEARELEAAGLAHILKFYQSFIRELASFFESLHYQTAFYIGAANLQIRLTQLYIPTTMPQLPIKDSEEFRFRGLYDLSLAIYNRKKPICNGLETENMKLFIITGANQGGKSTYLRSIGIAQLLMQSGLFVPAEYYCNKLFSGIFSHFTRREDTAMNSGKLDEELSRMDRILGQITPDSLLLMNESFATTTEREGSKIARDVVEALYENGTRIVMVTHLFEFTKSMFEKKPEHAIFLSAERLADGTRTYRIYEREPERTSYGIDLYDDIVGIKRGC